MSDCVPRHVAIIMDGNGRWAKKRAMPRSFGHSYGVKAVRNAVRFAAKHQVEVLTLFALSTENLTCRPKKEVDQLLALFIKQLTTQAQELHQNQIKLSFIGNFDVLPEELQTLIHKNTQLTKNNTGVHVVIAVNYSGRWDILNAMRRIASDVESNRLSVASMADSQLQSYLSMSSLPEPDLLIRTSGEHRISNFLLWQLAYTELFFTDTLWPDFDGTVFEQALSSFASRSRKFGRTPDQMEDKHA